ncbi:MAG: tetratricopeptide repeat protein [Candidatus Hermodarchaeota archaeon]
MVKGLEETENSQSTRRIGLMSRLLESIRTTPGKLSTTQYRIPHAIEMGQVEQLLQQGKFHEVLDKLDSLLAKERLKIIDRLKVQLLKSRILISLGKFDHALELARQVHEVSKDVETPLITLDALILMANSLLSLGNFDESLRLIKQGKNVLPIIIGATSSGLAEREANLNLYEGQIYGRQGKWDLALGTLQKSLIISEKMQNKLDTADSLSAIGAIYIGKGELDQALEYLQKSHRIFEELENQEKLATSFHNLGVIYGNKGEIDQSIVYFEKSLEIREQLGNQMHIGFSLTNLGITYLHKGDFNRSLDYLQKSLVIFEQLASQEDIGRVLNNIGKIYSAKGESDQALEYFHKSLAIFEELENSNLVKRLTGTLNTDIGIAYMNNGNLNEALMYMLRGLKLREEAGNDHALANSLFYLIIAFLEGGDVESAKNYLQQLLKIKERTNARVINQGSRVVQAMILKTSTRTRDKVKAQELFQQVAEEEITYFDITVRAHLNLCELLFLEFKNSKDPEILKEIKVSIDKVLNLAKLQNSYSLLAEIYILKSKLALIEQDVDLARGFLTQAHLIAEEKGLEKLAMTISMEYDAFLLQLGTENDLIKQEIPITESGELSGIENLITRLAQQRTLETPEPSEEEPVLLLILAESGINIFSKSFQSERQLDTLLIGGFLSAINTFGKQVFVDSGTIDRISYQDYTVVIKALDQLMFCYVFKGHSYLAVKKLESFIERLQASEVWIDIKSRVDKNKVKTLLDDPLIYEIITDVFN